MKPDAHHARLTQRLAERGQALVILLMLLPALAAAAALAVRGAITSARQLQAQQTGAQAQEAASFALRRCEALAMAVTAADAADPRTVAVTATQAEQSWNRLTSWRPGTPGLHITTVAGFGGRSLGTGQCVFQRLADGAQGLRFVVTARGLSADAQVSTQTGALLDGAEAWQQALLRKAADPCQSPGTSSAATCTPPGWTRRWRVLVTPPAASPG